MLRRRRGQPAVDDGFSKRLLRNLLQLDQDGGVSVEMRDREERGGMRSQRGLLAEVQDTNGKDGPSGGVSSPNRLISALLNGRSQAIALPETDHDRPLSASVTSGSPAAIRATSSKVITHAPYVVRIADGKVMAIQPSFQPDQTAHSSATRSASIDRRSCLETAPSPRVARSRPQTIAARGLVLDEELGVWVRPRKDSIQPDSPAPNAARAQGGACPT